MKLWTALGTTILHTRGPLPEVRHAWTRALVAAERLDDTEYRLRSLWGLCDYHTWTGDHKAALAIAERIRALAIEKGDGTAAINVERQTGTALRYLGRTAEARAHLERMIALYVPPAARSTVARFQLDPRSAARGTLANILWLQGHPEQAVRMATRQRQEAEAANHAVALCNALIHAACPVALFTGDIEAAGTLLDTIEEHVAAHAMTVWRSMAACLRGEWLLERGDASGLVVLRGALDHLNDVGFRMRYSAHLGTFAAGLGVHGEAGAARRAIEEAISLSAGSGEVWCMPELLRIRGDLRRRDGEGEAAEGDYLQALEEARRQGALSFELRAAMRLADLLHRSGGAAKAAETLAAVYGRFAEGLQTRDLRAARALLGAIRC